MRLQSVLSIEWIKLGPYLGLKKQHPGASLAFGVISGPVLETKRRGYISNFAARARGWRDRHLRVVVEEIGAARVKLHLDTEDTTAQEKAAATRRALGLLDEQFNGRPPWTGVEVYIHDANQACLGYYLPLGANVCKPVIILGNGVFKTKSRLVSHDIYDEAARIVAPPFARLAQAQAAVLHEFGHVLHQIQSPSHFFGLGKLGSFRYKAPSELTGQDYLADYDTHFLSAVTTTQMTELWERVSAVAGEVSQYAGTHPNEFVAETFCGLCLNRPFSAAVLETYRALGGPTLPATDWYGQPAARPQPLDFRRMTL